MTAEQLLASIDNAAPRGLLHKTYNLVHFSEFDRGGHFAALEQPDFFVTDVSAFVRQVSRK
jgi:hypothetical protein